MMKKVIDSLVDGAWLTQPPTFNGQLVRETTYFGDGSFGVVEYAFNGATSDMRITNLSFENRFTRDERKAIRRAALIDEDVQDFMSLAAKATHIDLSAAANHRVCTRFRANGINRRRSCSRDTFTTS
jgi:plasmid stability protein